MDFSGLDRVLKIYIDGKEYSDNKEDIKFVISRYDDGTKCDGSFEGTDIGEKSEFGYAWVCYDGDGRVGIRGRFKKDEKGDSKYAKFEFFNEDGSVASSGRVKRAKELIDEYDGKILWEEGRDKLSDSRFEEIGMVDVDELPSEFVEFLDELDGLGYDRDVVYEASHLYERKAVLDPTYTVDEFMFDLYAECSIDRGDVDGLGGVEGLFMRLRKLFGDDDISVFY